MKILIKKFVSFLLILIFLFLMLEVFQRCRYAYRTKNLAPFYYGFKKQKKLLNIYKQQKTFFREPFAILEKDKGKNILFIGTSSTFCITNDNYHTFPYLLQSKIDGISSLNAGRPGKKSRDLLSVLMQSYNEFCIPEMVVIYTGYNDIFSGGICPYKSLDRLATYSFLALTIKEKFFVLTAELEKKKDFEYRMQFVKKFEKNIEDCIKFAKSKNTDVVLIPEVLVAEKFDSRGDYRWYRELYLEIPATLKKLALKYNCLFLDPKDILYANWKENFVDTVHFSDKGSEIFSAFLARNLPFDKK